MSKQIVEQVKAELVARGQRWETNEDALQITGRVAWILRKQGAKLVSKRPEQNGAWVTLPSGERVKVSHDAIAFPNPLDWKDCLIGAGPTDNFNTPCWDHTNSSTAALIDPWDMDLVALPAVPVTPVVVPDPPATDPAPPVVTPEPPPAPVVPSNLEARLKAVEDVLRLLLELLAKAPAAAPTAPVYEAPYDIKAPWPIGQLKGTIVLTPRKP